MMAQPIKSIYSSIRSRPEWWFTAFFLSELWAVTVGINHGNPFLNPVFWFTGCCGAAIAGYFMYTKTGSSDKKVSPSRKWLSLGLLIAGLVVIGGVILKTTQANPINSKISDIVPSLKFYVTRLLSGEKVYAPMDFGKWTVDPTYLPMTWLPYVIAEISALDYRFYSFLILAIVILVLFAQQLRKDGSLLIVKCSLILLCFVGIASFHNSVFIHSVEFTIAAFYLVLVMALRRNSFWAIALSLLLCLLSRYSFTFWLPVFLLMYWIQAGWKTAFKTGFVILLGIIVIYGPFLFQDPEIFIKGMRYYSGTVNSLWSPAYFQDATEIPIHLKRGMSFSIFFYEFIPGDVYVRLKIAKISYLVASAASAIIIFIFYLKNRKRSDFNFNAYSISSLCIYLAVFYGFLTVPFSYLFIVPLFAKLPLVMKMGKFRSD